MSAEGAIGPGSAGSAAGGSTVPIPVSPLLPVRTTTPELVTVKAVECCCNCRARN
jgi:hypothetical protein